MEIDQLTQDLIFEWREHHESKPNIPEDYCVHIDHLRMQMDRWQATNDALRVVIADRLANIALKKVVEDD